MLLTDIMGDSLKAQSTSPRTVPTSPEIAAQSEGRSTHIAARPANDDDEILQANGPEEDGPSVIDDGKLYGIDGVNLWQRDLPTQQVFLHGIASK